MRADRVVVAVATPVGVAALYFLSAGSVDGGEVIGCLIVLVIGCGHAVGVARTGTAPLQLSLRGCGAIAGGFLRVPGELWHVGTGLLRAVRRGTGGTVTTVPFRFGAFDAADIGRRAAVVTAVSLAPNGVALGMEHDSDELILHRLVPQQSRGSREWPA